MDPRHQARTPDSAPSNRADSDRADSDGAAVAGTAGVHCAALSDFIERSPTPWHAASAGGDLLAGAGFIELGVSQD
ncbi:MAG: hypothetical protein KDB15_05180, partial [Microthrixaceae bacterium]|nr:hypothetical protein [Microthrixaceae bacterium]